MPENADVNPIRTERLWSLAAQVGLEINTLNTTQLRQQARDAFERMLDREIIAGAQNKLFAQTVIGALRIAAGEPEEPTETELTRELHMVPDGRSENDRSL